MSTVTFTASLILSVSALCVGLLVGWAHFRLRLTAGFVPQDKHRAELMALRRRYRRRLRAMRDAATRLRVGENGLRGELRVASDHQATQTKLLSSAQAEIATLNRRLEALNATLGDRDRSLALARAGGDALQTDLDASRERLSAFEREHGLMRIEHDELMAQTARLRVVRIAEAPAEPAESPPQLQTTGSRAELADRDARIHELECRLRESEQQRSEVETSLQTWKYRIAPMALHMKLRRERAEAAEKRAPKKKPADDLKRIDGIGRALEKKLHAEGITHFDQLATMSPAELASLAIRVGVAASRPERDGWTEQAQSLRAPPEERPATRRSRETA